MRRRTTQRAAIEKVLHQCDRPLTVEEILKYSRESVSSLNLATVYRNLKRLIEAGSVRQMNHPALGTLFERTGKGHHHHFHCHACNRVLELPGCALKEEEIAPEGFVVEHHDVFLSGICPSCAKS
jgi:Fur family ferric uptake transcriptional regulator